MTEIKMKAKLTTEQSQRLIEFGVDPNKASDFEEVDVTDLTDPNAFIETEYHRVFDLSDILSLLPKIIKYGNRVCRLKFQAIVSIHDGLSEVWQACYTHTSCQTNKEAPELIDALFELLCWTLTREKNEKRKQ